MFSSSKPLSKGSGLKPKNLFTAPSQLLGDGAKSSLMPNYRAAYPWLCDNYSTISPQSINHLDGSRADCPGACYDTADECYRNSNNCLGGNSAANGCDTGSP